MFTLANSKIFAARAREPERLEEGKGKEILERRIKMYRSV